MVEKLTKDQEKALYGILKFISEPINEIKDTARVLYSPAGFGKTHLTRFVCDVLRGKFTIAGVAPTHKAKKVLDRMLNDDCFLQIKCMTIASLLSKLRTHSYIGTNHYRDTGNKISLYQIFIIDECSMIHDDDTRKIISYAFKDKKKLLFVGDKYQIPNPTQGFTPILYQNGEDSGMICKADGLVFNIPGFELTTNMRQKSDNPIVPLYLEFRSAIRELREANIDRTTRLIVSKDKNTEIGVAFYTNKEEWYSKIAELYKKSQVKLCKKNNFTSNSKLIEDKKGKEDILGLHELKIICYTNDAVKAHNQRVRSLLGKGINPEKGDLVMGYDNRGFPELYLQNSQEYYLLSVTQTNKYRVLEFTGLVGMLLKTVETDSNLEAMLFVPDTSHPKNRVMLDELVKRADKVNSSYSTKADYKHYSDLKDRMVFMENIYKYRGEIMGETQFRNNNPLLFKSINEVIDEKSRTVLNNKLVKDIEEKYGNILQDRVADDKMFTDVEKIADKYCIIEKCLDYSYSCTSHRVQGSTYKTVFVDEPDFRKLRDGFNFKLNKEVKNVKERNQMMYVAYSRPSQSCHSYYSSEFIQ